MEPKRRKKLMKDVIPLNKLLLEMDTDSSLFGLSIYHANIIRGEIIWTLNQSVMGNKIYEIYN